MSSFHERVKRKSSRSQAEEEEAEDDHGGDDEEEDMGVVLKKWISCPRFSFLSPFSHPY